MATAVSPVRASAPAAEPTGGAGAGRGAPVRPLGWVVAFAAYLLAQAVQLVVLLHLDRRFFWLDDSQAQFGPITWWLGKTARHGRPPTFDPEQGTSANLIADMQNGVLDPLHWGLQALAARSSDFVTTSWGVAAICLTLLGSGVLVALLVHGVRPALAAPAALGAASSGFLLWYGSSWWPLMWSVAWLPWLWVGMTTRRWPGALVAGVATWALLDSGNPYALPFAVLAAVGLLVERCVRARTAAALLAPEALARLLACAGGVLIAAPTLLTTVQMSKFMGRQPPSALIGNTGFGVPNLLDSLLGGVTLLGQDNAWAGSIDLAPAMVVFVAAVPLLALVEWRRALRARGVAVALAVVVAAAVATQLPTTLSEFRYPLRYLVTLQVFTALLAVLAVSAAPRVTRVRLAVAGGLVVAEALLAASRSPGLLRWHAVGFVLTALAVAAAVLVLRRRPLPVRAVGAVVLLAAVVATPLVGEQMMVTVAHRSAAIAAATERAQHPGTRVAAKTTDLPLRAVPDGTQLGTTVAAYRRHVVADDTSLTVLTTSFAVDRGWAAGVIMGNGNLVAGLRPGFGSLAVSQKQLNTHWCRDSWGATCSDAQTLLKTAGSTGEPWVDVMASNTVLLAPSAPSQVRDWFTAHWRAAGTRGPGGQWAVFTRTTPLPGRVSVEQGVSVDGSDYTARLARGTQTMDRYVVTTGSTAGSLTFRIPYWPGLRATLDGRDVPVSTVAGSVLRVAVPAHTTRGELRLSYAPLGVRLLTPLIAAGAVVIVVAGLALAGAELLLRRRRGAVLADGTVLAGTSVPLLPPRIAHLAGQAVKFLLGSILGLAVDLTVFAVLTHLGVWPWLANVCSSACAILVVYAFVTKHVFAAERSRRSFVLFVAWYALSILVFSVLIQLLHDATHWPAFDCKLASLPFSFSANFLFSRIIFRGRRPAPEPEVAP